MATVEMTLDVRKPQECIEKVEGRQGDTATVIRVEVVDGGSPYDFTGKYLELALIRPDGEWVHVKDGCVREGSTNVWNCTLPVQATAYDGLIKLAYFVVRNTSDEKFRESTQRFLIDLDASATAEAHLGPYSDQVDRLIREAESIIDAWNAQMKAQQAAYLAAEAKRDESYEAAEAERDTRYSQAEQDRNARFEQSETARQNTFNTNEADRGKRSNEAVQAANSAADRANKAADDVHQALTGDLSAVFDTYLDTKKDVAGGFPKWETYQTGIKNAGTPDDVTLAKDSANKLYVKDAGITTAKIADLNVTTSKIADKAVVAGKIGDKAIDIGQVSDYLLFKIGILDVSNWNVDNFISFASGLDVGDQHELITGFFDFSKFSWADISKFANAVDDSACDAFIDKRKSASVSGYGTVQFQVIGANHDDQVSGEKAALTFQSVPCITTHRMNATNTTSGGWASTEMRTWLEGTLLNALPSDLRSAIKQVKKVYRKDTGSTTYTSNDKLWLLSEKELTGDTSYGNEGTVYAYWSSHNDRNSRVKTLNSSAKYWWLRSVYDSSHFRNVRSDGSLYGYGASNENGVAPCFSI